MNGFPGGISSMGIDVIDLTDDFEEDTRLQRQKRREIREIIELTDSDTEFPPHSPPLPLTVSPIAPMNLEPAEVLAVAAPASPLPVPPPPSPLSAKTARKPRNNTRSPNKKQQPSQTPSKYQGWRGNQVFEDVVVPDASPEAAAPKSERESKKRKREAEDQEIGERIRLLAKSVGWSQPNRNDQRTTKKNSTAIPYRYNEERPVPCDICGDKVPVSESTKLNCKHRHCNTCLQQNFILVTTQPNLWPAKCCRPLDHSLALTVLGADNFEQYLDVRRQKEEMSSTSCHSCQQPVPATEIIGGSTAFCIMCSCITCVHCTKAMHEGACLLDPETEKLLQVAKGKKWSKCPKCSNMVERNTGCNSMMCRCGTNFCYRCGRQMSTCSTSGGCAQLEFQSAMWKNQQTHKPITANSMLINSYIQRSMDNELVQIAARQNMAEQNEKAIRRQEVVSEIAALRARLQKKKKPDENTPTNRPVSGITNPTPTKIHEPKMFTIQDYMNAFPSVMQALEEKKMEEPTEDKPPQATPPEPPAPKVPSIMDKFRKSFPALMRTLDTPKPENNNLSLPEVQMKPVGELPSNALVHLEVPVADAIPMNEDLAEGGFMAPARTSWGFFQQYDILQVDSLGAFNPFFGNDTDFDFREFLA
ncbi:hypothetical protein H072_6898 [Dactylellina haptotyla CBS 200.50]|uniref:RBR-type E3 ubiquitin transferase n=1 Tax=Dactylellina haptotyla (strain CBS 200.50) TaxID=1284197 RepID=S8BIZ6_DACHA|nr:hypothetical protein H072_6898 [Dactylellina haptotyla CBS 200.50]